MTPTNDNMPTALAARAYREVMQQLRLRGEASASFIFRATRTALRLPEEQCGGEILDAMCAGIRQGVIDCNTAEPDGSSIIINSETMLRSAAPALH